MNIIQLEHIREHVRKMDSLLKEDSGGLRDIDDLVTQLSISVNAALKNLVWVKYLKATEE